MLNKKYQKIVIVLLILLISTTISMLNHWEFGGESWGYWYFARLLNEGGGFAVFDRSPLYALYLNAFSWIGYPASVTVEYLVTTLITLIAFVLLFRRFLGLWMAVFASLLWLIFIQVSEPPVQKLALACSFIALYIRLNSNTRYRISISYLFFALAFMFRVTYFILLFLFIAWDIYGLIKKENGKSIFNKIRPQISDWPLAIVLVLFVSFSIWQSPHPWNNIHIGNRTWFPTTSSSSLADAAFLQDFNMDYMESKYGTFKNHDWYFTNQEVFNGADNMIDATLANPSFVIKQLIKKIKELFLASGQMLLFTRVFSPYFLPFFSLLIIYGAFKSSADPTVKVFVIANLLIVFSTVLVQPKTRYMFPLLPVLTLSAYWYSEKINDFLSLKNNMRPKWQKLPVIFLLGLFSRGILDWVGLSQSIVNDLNSGNIRILEGRTDSMKRSYNKVKSLVRGCNGVMSLEHLFVGSFLDIPLENIYDVWEIPPFGRLSESVYSGLAPDRVDCLLISNNLSTNIGASTNFQIRYDNYIEPYTNYLKSIGAKEYKIDGFGKAIIYKNNHIDFNIYQNPVQKN